MVAFVFRSNYEARDENEPPAPETNNKPTTPTLQHDVDTDAVELFREERLRLERFVGVSYVKATERQSHYSRCRMAEQFDCLIHIDVTHATEVSKTKEGIKDEGHIIRRGTGGVDYSKWDKILEEYSSNDDYEV